jgi:hypothetical protein
VDVAARTDRGGNGAARLSTVRFLDGHGRPVEGAMSGEPLTIRLGYRGRAPLSNAEVFLRLTDEHGRNVTLLSSRFSGDVLPYLPPEGALDCTIPEVALAAGTYTLTVSLVTAMRLADEVTAAARLEVEPGTFFPSGRTPGPENGIVLTRHRWSLAE